MNKKISVIYSFRNEESVIPELIKRTLNALKDTGLEYEIIFVDDASNDRSGELLNNYAKSDQSIKVITMSNRFGQTQCLIAGLAKASGDCAIYLDSDLQDPPELFSKLVDKWKEGHEVVSTRRTSRAGENPLKMILTKLGYLGWNKISKINLPIESGDYKLVDRKVINVLKDIKEEDPFIRGLVTWAGYRHAFVDYDRDARHSGETHFPFWGGDPIETFIIGATAFSIVPLYLAFIISIIFLFITLGHSVYTVINSTFDLWKFLVLTGISFNFFCLGVIGAYIGRIHFQSRKRPLYIIKNTQNFT
jgi:dolichol-phosphate mannosyltransferase